MNRWGQNGKLHWMQTYQMRVKSGANMPTSLTVKPMPIKWLTIHLWSKLQFARWVSWVRTARIIRWHIRMSRGKMTIPKIIRELCSSRALTTIQVKTKYRTRIQTSKRYPVNSSKSKIEQLICLLKRIVWVIRMKVMIRLISLRERKITNRIFPFKRVT